MSQTTSGTDCTDSTSVCVTLAVREELFERKRGPGDTYNAVIRRLLDATDASIEE
jgi:hypothetical protein